jgi:hypothetical protein
MGSDLTGEADIVHPDGDCVPVSIEELIDVSWSGVLDSAYTMWAFVYSPLAHQYYLHRCGEAVLSTSGSLGCGVRFEKLDQAYEVIIVLADADADEVLQRLKEGGVSQEHLPVGIEEMDTLAVRRTR